LALRFHPLSRLAQNPQAGETLQPINKPDSASAGQGAPKPAQTVRPAMAPAPLKVSGTSAIKKKLIA
jgi:hypothetical protein